MTEGVPLLQLVIPPGPVNIDQGFIIKGAGTHLIIGGGEQLDHIIPVPFILGLQIL